MMRAGHRRDAEPADWLGALREPDFRRYFAGRVTSFVGTGMVPVALSFAVLEEGRSTSDVGVVLGAGALPMVLFLLLGGVVADRLGRRGVMMASDLVRALAQGALAAWLLTGRPPLWAFVLAELTVGAATAFFTPAMTGFIPEIARRERLQQANSLNAMAMWSGNLVGPAVAGVIVAGAGAGWAIGADAVTYLLSAACLARVRSTPPSPSPSPRESVASSLRAGWRDFWSRSWLWAIVIQFAFFHLLVYAPFLVLGAVVAKSSLGGAGRVGRGVGGERCRRCGRGHRDAPLPATSAVAGGRGGDDGVGMSARRARPRRIGRTRRARLHWWPGPAPGCSVPSGTRPSSARFRPISSRGSVRTIGSVAAVPPPRVRVGRSPVRSVGSDDDAQRGRRGHGAERGGPHVGASVTALAYRTDPAPRLVHPTR